MKSTNMYYYKYSIDHPEEPYSDWYAKNVIVIPRKASMKNDLTEAFRELEECIAAFNRLRKRPNKNSLSDPDIQSIVEDVIELLRVQFMNYTPFVQFFMTRGTNYDVYRRTKNDKKPEFIFDMLNSYCDNRYSLYANHGFTDSILQVVSDNYSHKRNSKTGIEKYLTFLKPYISWRLDNRDVDALRSDTDWYFLPDKGAAALFEQFVQEMNLHMESRRSEQDKRPDIVFKHGNAYYIIELKKMDVGGGGQNKQIVEIANFIKSQETSNNIHYATILDGNYWNILLEDDTPKVRKQRHDIEKALSDCKNNFFLNTEGTIKLFEDLFENEG